MNTLYRGNLEHITVMSVKGLPPVPPPIQNYNNETNNTLLFNNPILNDGILNWTTNDELRKACTRHNIIREPSQWCHNHFESLLQSGPTCGLVALAMLLNGEIPVSDIFHAAKSRGFTNNGEMFSVKNMFHLCQSIIEKSKSNFEAEYCNGSLLDLKYIKHLIEGGTMLLPYDSDHNHSPCLKNGHSAHWALITGILIIKGNVEDMKSSYEYNNVYVTAKHGKSLKLAIWNLHDLWTSNCNLTEMSHKRKNDTLNYVYPDKGMGSDDGLKNQFILLHKIE